MVSLRVLLFDRLTCASESGLHALPGHTKNRACHGRDSVCRRFPRHPSFHSLVPQACEGAVVATEVFYLVAQLNQQTTNALISIGDGPPLQAFKKLEPPGPQSQRPRRSSARRTTDKNANFAKPVCSAKPSERRANRVQTSSCWTAKHAVKQVRPANYGKRTRETVPLEKKIPATPPSRRTE